MKHAAGAVVVLAFGLGVAASAGCQKKTAPAPAPAAPRPKRPPVTDGRFLMPVEDVFLIRGRGTIVTGQIERGTVKVGDEVALVGIRATTTAVVDGVEMFRKVLDEAKSGDNVGILLRGVKREDVERGQVLAKPGSIGAHKRFAADAKIISKEEGGRSTPFFQGYRPQFFFRTTDVTGVVTLPAGVKAVNPGDDVAMQVELLTSVACEVGTRFAIREGGKTVGAGVVTEVGD